MKDIHGYIPLGISVSEYVLLGITTNRAGWMVNIVQGGSIWGIILSDPEDNSNKIPINEEVEYSAFVLKKEIN